MINLFFINYYFKKILNICYHLIKDPLEAAEKYIVRENLNKKLYLE